MATILLRFPAEGEPATARRAVTTEDGVRGWWSERTEGPSGVGSTMKVSFPDAPMTFDFEVVEESGARTAWRCLAGPPEWVGTTVSFDIEPGDGDSIDVLFTHDGWKTATESFPFIAYSWAQILPRLKSLIENETGDPYFKF